LSVMKLESACAILQAEEHAAVRKVQSSEVTIRDSPGVGRRVHDLLPVTR
jgi:hypothetical protein